MEKNTYSDKPTHGYILKHTEEGKDTLSVKCDSEVSYLRSNSKKALLAMLLGTIVEWYDYCLYGYMAVTFSNRFFPNTDPTVSFMNHLLVFALGYLTKPIGAYIFGSFGDGYGRKWALRYSIIGIALPTVIMGCLPSYDQLGIFAVILLCFCRLTQGLFISAEVNGVDIFIYETMPKKHACLANSLTWISASLGMGMASGLARMALMPGLPVWSWRFPFWFAGILGLIALLFRKYLIESLDYAIHIATFTPEKIKAFSNYWQTIKRNKLKMFLSLLIKGAVGGTYYFYFIFWNTYLHNCLKITTAEEACSKTLFLTLVSTFVAPFCGYLADRLGIIRSIKTGALFCIGMMTANGIGLYYFNSAPNWLMGITIVAIALFSLPVYVFCMKLFSTGERYRCMSMSHAFASIIFSSSTPLIATFTWKYFKNPVAPLVYCCLLLLIGFLATLCAQNLPAPSTQIPNQKSTEEKQDFRLAARA